ncbi:MAG: MFS transporter, partial [Chloroflexi bacterium]|nr:MFS transporter [Chloroflexota bacterium]
MIGISRRVYYGWFIVAAAGSMEFANAASAISILTIFVNPMAEEFDWSRTEISGATSLGAILGASLAPFTGRLVDRVGSRWPLALGGVAVALACVYLSAMQTLLGFYIA